MTLYCPRALNPTREDRSLMGHSDRPENVARQPFAVGGKGHDVRETSIETLTGFESGPRVTANRAVARSPIVRRVLTSGGGRGIPAAARESRSACLGCARVEARKRGDRHYLVGVTMESTPDS